MTAVRPEYANLNRTNVAREKKHGLSNSRIRGDGPRSLKLRRPIIGFISNMELSEFEESIEKALNKIPKKFREILEREGIQVLARDKVPGALQDRYGGRLLFGIFTGVPFNMRSMFNIHIEPTRIELYKDSFEKAFADRSEMEKQIVKTVIHEIGHYFGFSEKELRRRNL